MSKKDWWQITTLPASISKLKSVRRLHLYGSNLDRIPPEIGEMRSLEYFDAYTSYRLHWLPYEITRCRKLNDSRISTRALYGNYKYRPGFPRLHDDEHWYAVLIPKSCSVCSEPLGEALHRRWISLDIATDVVPLLVHACSMDCIRNLPTPHHHYVQKPHTGGHDVRQPPTRF